MIRRLVQVVANLNGHSAAGRLVHGLHRTARQRSLETEICARNAASAEDSPHHDPGLARLRSLIDASAREPTVFIYHYDVPHHEVDAVIGDSRIGRRVAFCHDVVPPSFSRGWDPARYRTLASLHSSVPPVLQGRWTITGDSDFTIARIGSHPEHARLPPVRPGRDDGEALSPSGVERKACAQRPALLFVGAFSPHNRQDVLLFALKDLQNAGIDARLILAGESGTFGRSYLAFLSRVARTLGLARRVHFMPDADDFTLTRAYGYCQYFVVASEHAGYCATIEAAVAFGCIPVARPFGGVADFLRSSPLLAGDRRHATFFSLIERVILGTFSQPIAFRTTQERAAADVGANLAHYLSPDDFLRAITA